MWPVEGESAMAPKLSVEAPAGAAVLTSREPAAATIMAAPLTIFFKIVALLVLWAHDPMDRVHKLPIRFDRSQPANAVLADEFMIERAPYGGPGVPLKDRGNQQLNRYHKVQRARCIRGCVRLGFPL